MMTGVKINVRTLLRPMFPFDWLIRRKYSDFNNGRGLEITQDPRYGEGDHPRRIYLRYTKQRVGGRTQRYISVRVRML